MSFHIPSYREAQVNTLRRLAGLTTTSLTIEIRAHTNRVKHRRYFESDEDFAQHEREIAIYRSAESTFEWEYQTPPSLWSAADVDAVITFVADTLSRLPLVTEHDRMFYGRRRFGSLSAAVGFDFQIRGRKYRREAISMWVTSGVGPYRATVTLPERPPVSAIIRLIEIHGSADFQIGLRPRADEGYVPTLAKADQQADEARDGGAK
jgi:hypothetical protein